MFFAAQHIDLCQRRSSDLTHVARDTTPVRARFRFPVASTRAEAAVRLAAELRGRHALDLQEAPVEVGHVVEAHLVADVGDEAVGLHEQVACAVDAYPADEVGEAVARGPAEKAAEAALAHARSEERRGGKECRSRWSPYH